MRTAGPPMLPYTYNSNYQFLETAGAIVIHIEMIHDARIIYMDGRPHAPASQSMSMPVTREITRCRTR